jgi:prepilin-type processing-associated H-X9-DG protein
MAGETDSGVEPARGCNRSVQRLTTHSAAPTQGFADGHVQAQASARSVLKMKQ